MLQKVCASISRFGRQLIFGSENRNSENGQSALQYSRGQQFKEVICLLLMIYLSQCGDDQSARHKPAANTKPSRVFPFSGCSM